MSETMELRKLVGALKRENQVLLVGWIKALRELGKSDEEISKTTGLSLTTVRKMNM